MRAKTERVTRLDYCQYLLVSQINYTLTNYAEHTEQFSHDMANRYLADDVLRPHLVWENIRDQVVPTPYGFLVFDDTIVDKNFSHKIELVRRQYSGNAHGVIKGIGVVTCVYVNPGNRLVLHYSTIGSTIRRWQDETRPCGGDATQLCLSKAIGPVGGFDGHLVCDERPPVADRRLWQNLLLPAERQPAGGRFRGHAALSPPG